MENEAMILRIVFSLVFCASQLRWQAEGPLWHRIFVALMASSTIIACAGIYLYVLLLNYVNLQHDSLMECPAQGVNVLWKMSPLVINLWMHMQLENEADLGQQFIYPHLLIEL